MKIRVDMKPTGEIIKRLKLDEQAQAFHTSNVMRHMVRYMGKRAGSGVMRNSMISGTNIKSGLIKVIVPYAKVQYYGVNHKGTRIRYNISSEPLAGPKWDERMMSAEGDKVRNELGNYLDAKVVK